MICKYLSLLIVKSQLSPFFHGYEPWINQFFWFFVENQAEAPAAVPPTAVAVAAIVLVAKPAAPTDCNTAKDEPATTLPIEACAAAAADPPTTPAAEKPYAPRASGASPNAPTATAPPKAPYVTAFVIQVSGVSFFQIVSVDIFETEFSRYTIGIKLNCTFSYFRPLWKDFEIPITVLLEIDYVKSRDFLHAR